MATIVTRAGKGSPLTNQELDNNFTNLNTDKAELSGSTFTGNLSLGDNVKAQFGDAVGGDLQIHHNGSHSLIEDTGQGDLKLRGANLKMQDPDGNDFIAMTDTGHGGTVELKNTGTTRLTTTSTGTLTTGTSVVSTSMMIGSTDSPSRDLEIKTTNPHIRLTDTDASGSYTEIFGGSGITTINADKGQNVSGSVLKLSVDATDGITIDSNHNVSIPNGNLDVTGSVVADGLTVDTGANSYNALQIKASSATGGTYGLGIGSSSDFTIYANGTSKNLIRATAFGDISFYDGSGNQGLFWDSSTSRLGLGVTNPDTALHVKTTAINTAKIKIESTAANSYPTLLLKNDVQEYQLTTHGGLSDDFTIYDGTAGVHRLRINTSGNATFSGSVTSTGFTTSANTRVQASSGMLFLNGPSALAFEVGAGSEKMRLTSTGLGIGTSSPTRQIHSHQANAGATNYALFTNTTTGSTSSDGVALGLNATSDGYLWNYEAGNLIFGTSASERMRLNSDGSCRWTPDGTTHDMTLTASGNLLVGKTALGVGIDGAQFIVGGYSGVSATNNPSFFANRNGGDGSVLEVGKNGVSVGSLGVSGGNNLFISGSVTDHSGFVFATGQILPTKEGGAGTNGVESLGSSSYRFKDLYLSGKSQADTYEFAQNSSASNATDAIYRATTATMAFKTGGQEAARIDASQNLLVGTSSVQLYASSSANGGVITSGGAFIGAANGPAGLFNRVNSEGDAAQFFQAGNYVGSISVSTSATFYNTSSDERLKENIVDSPVSSDDIDAIQVRSFDWKASGEHQKYGMVAQELQAVAPDAVSIPEDPEEMMGLDYSKLVPMLIKEIQSLRQRVASLEE